MSSFCSLRTNRTVLQKWTLKKNTKQKSKNKDNDSDVQSKADSDEDGDSETVIEKASPRNKNILCIFVMDPQNPHATKSGYNVISVLNILCDFFQSVRFSTRVRFRTTFGAFKKLKKIKKIKNKRNTYVM